ncbi:MAG: cobalamin-dependent protein [Gammaproteobacteria bacterium]|nr:cobalamin-dependent protein [Gammaproteobacteria bacterium]
MIDPIVRSAVFPEPELPDSREFIDRGKALAKTWGIGHSEFLQANGCSSEAEYKRFHIRSGRIMQHAQIGYRDPSRSLAACSEIYESCLARGVTVDRYGICLDWSMGFPEKIRKSRMKGTGLILEKTEDFVSLSNAAPVASHYGDFVLGFPAALENTRHALSAGATSIGNLGQYFTFRLPNWEEDVTTTASTISALALMAAQPAEVLVHSNLDDGFAAVFQDLACALGIVLIETYLVEDLLGGTVSHCYGHHYSTPVVRHAFHKALSRISHRPGTMVYGNTVAYQGTDAQNYASLAGYLLVDIQAQRETPSGHAINPVPVTENQRIPDIGEIVDAQLFAHRMVEQSLAFQPVTDSTGVDHTVERLVAGAQQFKNNLMAGFENGGIDIHDPLEMFLAIRRIGGKKLEQLYGPGRFDPGMRKRCSIVLSDTVRSIDRAVERNLERLEGFDSNQLSGSRLKIIVATTDVHEHGKMLIEGIFGRLGISVIDGGVSTDPRTLAKTAEDRDADAIALSTYNGVALTYFQQLKDELVEAGTDIPVLIGGRLNEIPAETDTSLPRDVTSDLEALGAVVCRHFHDAVPCLAELAQTGKNRQPGMPP